MKVPPFSAYTASKADTAAIINEVADLAAEADECPECHGDGQVQVHWNTHSGHPASGWLTCHTCNGSRTAATT